MESIYVGCVIRDGDLASGIIRHGESPRIKFTVLPRGENASNGPAHFGVHSIFLVLIRLPRLSQCVCISRYLTIKLIYFRVS